jgi:hypothetical protein
MLNDALMMSGHGRPDSRWPCAGDDASHNDNLLHEIDVLLTPSAKLSTPPTPKKHRGDSLV